MTRELGAALRDIRKRTTRTQDGWHAKTGMSQSYLSSMERGETGWESLRSIGGHLETIGVDPVELLRLAVAHAELPEEERELMVLWSSASDDTRRALLTLLRNERKHPPGTDHAARVKTR